MRGGRLKVVLLLFGFILVGLFALGEKKAREQRAEARRLEAEQKANQERVKKITEQVQARISKYGKEHEAQKRAERLRRIKLMDVDLSVSGQSGRAQVTCTCVRTRQ